MSHSSAHSQTKRWLTCVLTGEFLSAENRVYEKKLYISPNIGIYRKPKPGKSYVMGWPLTGTGTAGMPREIIPNH